MVGLKNLLQYINDNWSLIICILGLIIAIYEKVKKWLGTTTEEKIEKAKTEITQIMLDKVTKSEEKYKEWVAAGAIKRSQVISEIFKEYPILNKVVDQEELIAWIDEQIDAALPKLRDIIKQNVKTVDYETEALSYTE